MRVGEELSELLFGRSVFAASIIQNKKNALQWSPATCLGGISEAFIDAHSAVNLWKFSAHQLRPCLTPGPAPTCAAAPQPHLAAAPGPAGARWRGSRESPRKALGRAAEPLGEDPRRCYKSFDLSGEENGTPRKRPATLL